MIFAAATFMLLNKTAQYSHHLPLVLGNCHGGLLQLNLLIHIWLKFGIVKWVLIYLHLILDFDLLYISQKYQHPTTKSRISIPLADPKLTVEKMSLLLGTDLPYFLAAEVSVTCLPPIDIFSLYNMNSVFPPPSFWTYQSSIFS